VCAILNFRLATDLCRHVFLLPCAKFHWNRTIACWIMAKRTLFKWQPSAVLNFKKCPHLVMWLSSTSKSAFVYQTASKSDFVDMCRFNDLQDGGRAPSWIFRNLDLTVRDLNRHAILLACAQSAAELSPKTILKWRPSAVVNSKNFHIWSSGDRRVPNLLLCISST